MKKTSNNEYYKKLKLIEDKFIEEREIIEKDINTAIKLLSRVDTTIESQNKLLLLKNSLTTKMTNLVNKKRLVSENIESKRVEFYTYYKTQYNLSLNDTEINRHCEAKKEPILNKVKVIESQIKFFDEKIKIVDSCLYGVKNVIEYHKYLLNIS